MKRKRTVFIFVLTIVVSLSINAYAHEIYRVRLFFGLSVPDGSAVSLENWQLFLNEEIVKSFDAFNVVDS